MEPIGILVIRMLWLTPTLLGPNSSEVIETAAANMKPELNPIRAVPVSSIVKLPEPVNKNKAIGVGNNAMAIHPVRAKYNFLHQCIHIWFMQLKCTRHLVINRTIPTAFIRS